MHDGPDNGGMVGRMGGMEQCASNGSVRNLLGLIARYVLAVYAMSWSCWCAAGALLTIEGMDSLVGALEVLGTLCPPIAAYLLFPCIKACGLVPMGGTGAPCRCSSSPASTNDDRDGGNELRAGFWRFAFGGTSTACGWAAFALLFVWRWMMFRISFGFPATPVDALANVAATLPVLFLGGGFEEIGWRGCLQPAVAALVARVAPRRNRIALSAFAAAVVTGLVWGAWHLPLFFIPGTFQNSMTFAPILGIGVALSCSFGALTVLTGSLLYPIVAHAWYNAMLVAVPLYTPLSWAMFATEALVSLAVTVYAVRRKSRMGM